MAAALRRTSRARAQPPPSPERPGWHRWRNPKDPPPPFRCTRRCPVSGSRVALRRAPHGPAPSPEGLGTGGSSSLRRIASPEGDATRPRGSLPTPHAEACTVGAPPPTITPEGVAWTQASAPEGTPLGESRPKAASWHRPHLQQAGEDRLRARQTSSPFERSGLGRKDRVARSDPKVAPPTLARRERGGYRATPASHGRGAPPRAPAPSASSRRLRWASLRRACPCRSGPKPASGSLKFAPHRCGATRRLRAASLRRESRAGARAAFDPTLIQ